MKLVEINLEDGARFDVVCDSVSTTFNQLSMMHVFTFREITSALLAREGEPVRDLGPTLNVLELSDVKAILIFDA